MRRLRLCAVVPRAQLTWHQCMAINLFLASLPIGKLLFRFVRSDPVPFLDVQGELLTVARDHVNVGKLAPASLEVALELLPATFDAIPFHFGSLVAHCCKRHLEHQPDRLKVRFIIPVVCLVAHVARSRRTY